MLAYNVRRCTASTSCSHCGIRSATTSISKGGPNRWKSIFKNSARLTNPTYLFILFYFFQALNARIHTVRPLTSVAATSRLVLFLPPVASLDEFASLYFSVLVACPSCACVRVCVYRERTTDLPQRRQSQQSARLYTCVCAQIEDCCFGSGSVFSQNIHTCAYLVSVFVHDYRRVWAHAQVLPRLLKPLLPHPWKTTGVC